MPRDFEVQGERKRRGVNLLFLLFICWTVEGWAIALWRFEIAVVEIARASRKLQWRLLLWRKRVEEFLLWLLLFDDWVNFVSEHNEVLLVVLLCYIFRWAASIFYELVAIETLRCAHINATLLQLFHSTASFYNFAKVILNLQCGLRA